MLVNNDEAIKRLGSSANLINRLKTSSSRAGAMSLFGVGRKDSSSTEKTEKIEIKEEIKVAFNPFQTSIQPSPITSLQTTQPSKIEEYSQSLEQPSEQLDDILKNNESQIKLGLAHDSALNLLTSSLALLATKLDDVKADKLPSVIGAASKTVESIRRERAEASKNGKDKEVHYHFYTPEQRKVSDYEVIDVA